MEKHNSHSKKTPTATYQGYHCLIGPPFPTSNPFPDPCILERSLGPRPELSDLASTYRYQTALEGRLLLFILCVRLSVWRNWKRHVFGPDRRGRGCRCGPSDPYRPEFRCAKSLKGYAMPRFLRCLGLRCYGFVLCKWLRPTWQRWVIRGTRSFCLRAYELEWRQELAASLPWRQFCWLQRGCICEGRRLGKGSAYFNARHIQSWVRSCNGIQQCVMFWTIVRRHCRQSCANGFFYFESVAWRYGTECKDLADKLGPTRWIEE